MAGVRLQVVAMFQPDQLDIDQWRPPFSQSFADAVVEWRFATAWGFGRTISYESDNR